MVFAPAMKAADRHSHAIVRAKDPLRMTQERDSTECTQTRCRFRRTLEKVPASRIRFHCCIPLFPCRVLSISVGYVCLQEIPMMDEYPVTQRE